jgi:ParB family transcriptional regulator, chromosome partitioning protein
MAAQSDIIQNVSLNDLRPSPYQSRLSSGENNHNEAIDDLELKELAESIDTNKLMQPIVVRRMGDVYEIIDGHRRVAALRQLGRDRIRAIVKRCTEKEAMIMSVIGNLDRKNLRPVELALQYQRLMDSGFFSDKRSLSQALGKDESYVGDLLKTLKMDSRILEDLKAGHGIHDMRILRIIRNAEKVNKSGISKSQYDLYQMVKREKMTRKELSELVKRKKQYRAKKWQIQRTQRRLSINIDTSKMSADEIQQLEKLLEAHLKKSL